MADRTRGTVRPDPLICPDCARPLATDADEQATAPGEGEDLCWREYQGGVCTGEPVDWRQRYLDEADARVAAEGACYCAEAEVERLRAVETARSEGCACGDDESCRFVRERDAARAEIETLRQYAKSMEYETQCVMGKLSEERATSARLRKALTEIRDEAERRRSEEDSTACLLADLADEALEEEG